MTTPNAFDMSDATIERMLAERAGQLAPAGLVSGIMSAVNAVPQRRRAWLPQIRVKPLGWTGNRALIAAATVAIAALAVAAGVIVGALFRPPTPRVEPVPLPTQSATSAPSLEPTATWTPGPSDFAVVNGPLVVYQFNDTFVELFTLDPFNGRKVVLGTLQKASSAMGQSIHWSADRKRAFVFENSDSVRFVVDVDLGTIQPVGLTSSGARDAVSPAGDLVARVEDEGGNGSSLSIVDLDDTEVLRAALPAGMQASSDIAWSPDGTSVLVSGCLPCERSPGAQHDHVYAVEVSDGTLRELADSTSGSFGWLRWSPDMATIAFSRCAEACPGGIGLLGLPDSTVTQLTTTADRTPVWSPAGRRIAFARDSGAGRGIYVMDADGENLARLTSAASDNGDRSPFWSPDGAWIVFTRWASDTGLGDLYIVSSTGGEPRLIVQNAVADW